MVQWVLRLALLMISGPPERELNGGVPVATWEEAEGGRRAARRNTRTSKERFLTQLRLGSK
jgi:hypothetical protein